MAAMAWRGAAACAGHAGGMLPRSVNRPSIAARACEPRNIFDKTAALTAAITIKNDGIEERRKVVM